MKKEFTYEELDFEEDKERADKLLEIVLNTPDFNLQSLVMPFRSHNTGWGTAAYILSKLDFDRIKFLTPGLLRWIQDLNWYGANTIFDKLLTFPPDFLASCIETAVVEGLEENDLDWIANMAGFTYQKILTENNFSDKRIFQILKDCEDMAW